MCLLVVVARTQAPVPLLVGANRDEMLDRPATPMTVLGEAEPRILGGRDERRGGTWLAVNEFGVVAGLTNRPPNGAVDPVRRSRGELPLALARHPSAAAGVAEFTSGYPPSEYNPSWLLVGDRDTVFAVDMTGDDAAEVTELGPGVHILENAPFGAPSAKADRARTALGDIGMLAADEVTARLEAHLGDHQIPPGPDSHGVFSAACVHADGYGTRWSAVVAIPADRDARPSVRYADGPSCRTPFADATSLWR